MMNLRLNKTSTLLAVSILGFSLVLSFICFSAGCSRKNLEQVSLSLWCDSGNTDITNEMVESFKAKYSNEAIIDVTVSEESASTCAAVALSNIIFAPDVFVFADDQIDDFMDQHALLEITHNTDRIIAENGGRNAGVIKACTFNNKLYAYPELNGNGYFLYYNKKYFTKKDIESLERIVEVCNNNGKKFCMEVQSGWYLYSFFKGCGFEVFSTGVDGKNTCNWNEKVGKFSGVDVAQAIMDVSRRPGFYNADNSDFVKGIKDGSIIAGANGGWNANLIESEWGENYGACKLPTFNVKGEKVQMASFAGFKLVGVNANTDNPLWSQRLAEWITNEQNQLKLFERTGECPSNLKAASSDAVCSSPAVKALSDQSKYAYIQRVGNLYWNPTHAFGVLLSEGHADNINLQDQLDKTVKAIKGEK